jgi:acetoin utilization deacetylase AcuC-like enzyme
VFWIAGADVHRDDRFGQLLLTDDDIAARDSLVLDLVLARAQPLVVLYGGGYNRDREHTARLHAATVLRTAEAVARRRHGAG